MADTSCSDSDIGGKSGKDSQKDLLVAASSALQNDLPLEAAEKYKSALEKLNCKSNQKIPMGHLVIRYALCIALIKCNGYNQIVEAIGSLQDLIDSGYASKLPALYLALAKAYYVLNRFKKALEFIEKGLKAIQTNSKVKQHTWPGLQRTIEETGKDFLHKDLISLQKDCKNGAPPDAVCSYGKCLEVSDHIAPTSEIYFSDLDFKPFLFFQCDFKCKLVYHELCWENLHDNDSQRKEPEDMLGTRCIKCASNSKPSVINEACLIGSEGFDNPLSKFCYTSSGKPVKKANSIVTKPALQNGSVVKAKIKSSSFEEQIDDQAISIPRSVIASYCTPQDDIKVQKVLLPNLETAKELIDRCRAIKFGYLDHEYVNPELQCFGHPFLESSSYVDPDEIETVDKGPADFVFSYYQSMFDKDGIHRIEDLQEAWTSTVCENLGLPKSFTDRYTSVAEFLLSSEKFAAIDDVIGTSDLLPDMFSKAEAEITESVRYLLSSRASNSHKTNNINNQTLIDDCNSKHHNNNCDVLIYSSTTSSSADNDGYSSDPSNKDSDGYDQSETGKDNNDNAIYNSSDAFKIDTPGINGDSNTDLVYMSEEDEEIDSSLVIVEDQSVSLAVHNATMDLSKLNREPAKPDVSNQSSQTDNFIDIEKEKLIAKQQMLVEEVNELRFEKVELSRVVEQFESVVANQESKHSRAIKSITGEHEQIMKMKLDELTKVTESNSLLEQQLTALNEILREKESENSKLDSTLDKLRRTNAKEMYNFEKKLESKQEEFQNLLKSKDEQYIQLWKAFCEFKINKFNNLCNDRINVLSQLKEMMSDTQRPTKIDLKSYIEKYEEEMISVALKSSEVNEVYNQTMEKLTGGRQIQLPAVVELPDLKNMPYPPEGAFDYLQNVMKPKQDEFGLPRNHFSQGSKFYPRPFTSNGLQPLSQPSDSERFPPMSTSSIFGHQHNETMRLWNDFTPPSTTPSVMPFDMSNTNGSHLPLHQGFGAPGSMMQPQLNLLPNLMPYQSSSSSSVPPMMGQTRSTPSPSLPFPTMNGSAFSAPSVIGSKLPSAAAFQKPVAVASAAPPTPIVKSTTPVAAAIASAAVPQGAVPKLRVQTATAAMTPIVPSKTNVRMPPKVLKASDSNYGKLMRNLQKMFPTRTDMELTQSLKMVREKNGNTLSSLSYSDIVSKAEDILNKQTKHTSMGFEKFGQAAWGTAKAPVVEWEGSEQDECCICMTAMSAKEVYVLECKHAFHKECIRTWLLQDSVCPNCRTHSRMIDEFPPLG